jgi:hypothetical protein
MEAGQIFELAETNCKGKLIKQSASPSYGQVAKTLDVVLNQ